MTHLAIDLALGTTGLCWGPDVDNVHTVTCPNKLSGGDRLDWWYRALRLHFFSGAETIVVEAPILYLGRAWGTINTLKLHGVLEWMCTNEGLTYVDCAPSVLKKWATGNGLANKPLMMAAAQERGWNGTDHNAADAFLLWHWYQTTGCER
jgi:Holliday junction resolvasome RuvABC endonuclease subunit